MMPRGLQALPIVFTGGVDTKTDPHSVQPPALTELDNVVFDRPGSLRKRKGTAFLGSGGAQAGANVLANFEGQLLHLGDGHAYSFGSAAAAWRDLGAFVPVSVETSGIASGAASLLGADCASAGGLTAYAWRSSVDGHVYGQLVDQVTGAIVLPVQKLSGSSGSPNQPVQVVAQSGYLVVLYVYGNTLRARSLSSGSPTAWSAEASFSTLGSPTAFSAAPGDGTYLHVVTRDATSNQLKVAGIAPATPSISVAAVTFGTPYAGAAGVLAICQSGSQVCILGENSSTELHTWVRLASNYNAVAETSNGGITASIPKNGALCSAGSTSGWYAWVTVLPSAPSLMADPTRGYLQLLFIKSDSTQTVNNSFALAGTSVASQGLAVSGDHGYCWIRQRTAQQSAYLLVDETGALIARACAARATRQPLGAAASGLPHIASAGGTSYLTALITQEAGAPGTLSVVSGVSSVALDTAYRPRPVALRQGLFIPGGLPQMFDGVSLSELGFLAYPELGAELGQCVVGTVTARAILTAYSLGDIRRPSNPNGFEYVVTTAGTSSAGTPTWPTRIGGTVTDGTVVWTCRAYLVNDWLASTSHFAGAMVKPVASPNGYWYQTAAAGSTGASEPTWPTVIGATVTDGGVTWRCMGPLNASPAQADGTRTYKFTYEWLNAKGVLERSQPSQPISVTVAGQAGVGASLLTVRTLNLTSKVGVRIVVYRNDLGSTILHQLLSIPNDPTVGSLTIVDDIGDTPSQWQPGHAYSVGDRVAPSFALGLEARCTTAGTSGTREPAWPGDTSTSVPTDGTVVWALQLSAAGQPALYTTGGVLPNAPPPACTLATSYGARLVLAGIETDGQQLLISKAGDDPLTMPLFTFDASGLQFAYAAGNDGGDVTALAVVDGQLVAFKRTRIAVLTGEPYDDTGNNNSIGAPRLLPLDVGALSQHGVVVDRNGCYFASARGIYLLTRGLEAQYIGAQVEGYGATVTGAAVMTGREEVRFATDQGVLVYFSLLGVWCRHTGSTSYGTVVDVAPWLDRAAYAKASARAVVEHLTRHTDIGADPVLMRLVTGHLAPAGVATWTRFFAAQLVAQVLDNTSYALRLWFDGDESIDQSIDFPALVSDTGDAANSSDATYRLDFARMRGRSLKIELLETAGEIVEGTAGLNLVALSLLWAPFSPDQKVPAAQQKG